MKHVFYPPTELPTQVPSYAKALVDHKKEYGDVTGNSPADLKDIVAEAKKLSPLAQEIEDLQLTLAHKLEQYHKAAAPLWTHFSERLDYARTYAEKNDKGALASFLKSYAHHTARHAAAVAAGAVTPATTTTTTTKG